MPNHLFVYGSLRSESAHPMARRLAASARLVGKASARGVLYDLGSYSGAMFGPEHKRDVIGEVFALPEDGRLLATLDGFEGTANENAISASFERITIKVKLASGGTVAALTYALRAPPRKSRPIASGDFIAHLRRRKPRMAPP